MTTADPLSLSAGEAPRRQRRHDPAARDAAGRPRDADRGIPAARRRRPGVPPRVGRGRRAARAVHVPRRRSAAPARGPRRHRAHPDAAGHGPDVLPDLPIETTRRADPLDAIRAFVPRRRVEPTEGMPRFTGGAVGALAYDAVSLFEPTVPLPDRDPVGVPTAAFIETDLVLVFDHLTHTLSAIASLHTETPDLEGRYRIAEAAIFEALERTADRAPRSSPERAERRHDRRRPAPAAPRSTRASGATSTSMPSRSRRTRSRPARRSRSCSPGASRSTCRPIRRPARRSTGSACIAPPPRQSEPVPVLRPDARRSRSSARRRSCCSRSRATSSRPTRSRARDHAAPTRARTPILAEQLQRDPKERAEHVMLVDLGRNDLGRVSRAGTVTVSKYMEVERYSHVLHLVSHVEGRLQARSSTRSMRCGRCSRRAPCRAPRRSGRCS